MTRVMVPVYRYGLGAESVIAQPGQWIPPIDAPPLPTRDQIRKDARTAWEDILKPAAKRTKKTIVPWWVIPLWGAVSGTGADPIVSVENEDLAAIEEAQFSYWSRFDRKYRDRIDWAAKRAQGKIPPEAAMKGKAKYSLILANIASLGSDPELSEAIKIWSNPELDTVGGLEGPEVKVADVPWADIAKWVKYGGLMAGGLLVLVAVNLALGKD